MKMKKVKHLIVDSAAFIKNAPIHEFAENIYTVEGAIREIRDKATRQRLQFLPYQLKVKEPSPEAYKHVLSFSKKTGDFSTLSTVDLQIIALTYQLEKENVGTSHLNTHPYNKVTSKPCCGESELSGFYYPQKKKHSEVESTNDSPSGEDGGANYETAKQSEENAMESQDNETISEGCRTSGGNSSDEDSESQEGEEESDNEEDDSEESWITSSNIEEMQKKMGALVLDNESAVCVACISTDFSIQNVLLQIGIHILSMDGMLIKNARMFILRCYACYKTTSNSEKKFCPNCGNKTLKRVAVSYDEDGSKNIHINFKKPINIRGTRFSLPMPRGGKHAVNPLVVEDQRIPHNRPPKMALEKIDVLSPEYEALSSPFAVNDVYSRAASLGIRCNQMKIQKKNPNEWSKRTGNKKRKK